MDHNDIGYLLNRAARNLRLGLGGALTDVGLRPQQAAVLMAIARSPEGHLTPTGVADAIGTDAATTTGLLERLTRDGWIASEPNPDDGRSRWVLLTDKARRTLPKIMATAEAVSARSTATLTPEELETLRGLLSRLCDTDGADSGNGSSR